MVFCATLLAGGERVIIRKMTPDDLEEIMAIEEVSFDNPWQEEMFEAEMSGPISEALSVEIDGMYAGYMTCRVILDEAHLMNVAIHPDFRRRGYGRRLVQQFLDDCRERGVIVVYLEVRPSNASARKLYRRFGFRTTGVRNKYYENGEDALLMELTVP